MNSGPGSRVQRSFALTSKGEPRGYIQAQKLKELWFHTGSNCNLSCPFCLEGSTPGDNRIEFITLEDVKPWLEEALLMGIEQFSFTGGEPFINPHFLSVLEAVLEFKPCLVLTNGTAPLQRRFEKIKALLGKPHPLQFRISIDFPDEKLHDRGRGEGSFKSSIESIKKLKDLGFKVSVARQMSVDDEPAAEEQYRKVFRDHGLPENIHQVSFPDFLPPGSSADVPEISEHCMKHYHTEESRAQFMCHFSRMVLKKKGKVKAWACTLVDDDDDYALSDSLRESMDAKVLLKHHRCFSCFKYGASCSES